MATDTESDGGHESQPDSPVYDPLQDRASFISTASSHDLTVHTRANTSFDPVMGLTAQGVGVGRFNTKIAELKGTISVLEPLLLMRVEWRIISI